MIDLAAMPGKGLLAVDENANNAGVPTLGISPESATSYGGPPALEERRQHTLQRGLPRL